MSSYFSSLLTTTTNLTSKVKSLIPSENDGDTEDDTHLCRVFRSYYTEKGRNFPAWLPPDPKAPAPVVIQPVYSQNVGSRYGGLQNQAGGEAGRGGPGGGALSSLWDSQPQQQQEAVGGLRQGRGQMGRNGGGAPPPRNNPFARQQQNATLQPQVEARPLPSQRAGSYQTAQPTPPGSSSGFASAKDRLKGKLDRGRASPAPSSNSTSSAGGGYEDRYAGGGGGGGGGAYDSGRGGDRPFVAATAPWASSESEFGGGGYGGGGYDSGRRSEGRQGLPSGPRAGRGPGLPSGPRGPR